MDYFKNILFSFLYSFGFLIISVLILTFFNYFDIVDGGFFTFLLIFISCFSVFLGSFMLGKKGNNKGWLEGIKFGIIYIFFIFLLNIFVFNFKFSFKYIVFLLILLVSSIFGGMVGINLKKEK